MLWKSEKKKKKKTPNNFFDRIETKLFIFGSIP